MRKFITVYVEEPGAEAVVLAALAELKQQVPSLDWDTEFEEVEE
jgi:hypothetical protein